MGAAGGGGAAEVEPVDGEPGAGVGGEGVSYSGGGMYGREGAPAQPAQAATAISVRAAAMASRALPRILSYMR